MHPPPSARLDRLAPPALDGLYRLAVRLERDPVAAEDLLQQALLVALAKLDQLDQDGAFRVWASRIVLRTWQNRCKRRGEEPVDPGDLDNVVPLARRGPDEQADAGRLRARLSDAMDALPEDQRQAVWLVDGEGFKFAEAAEILGIAPGTAASRVARGRSALRLTLQRVAQEQGVIR